MISQLISKINQALEVLGKFLGIDYLNHIPILSLVEVALALGSLVYSKPL